MAWHKTCIHFVDAANMRVCCTCTHTHTHTDKQLMHAYISVARSSGTRIKKLDLTRLNELKYAKGSQAAVLRLLLLAIESESCRCAAGFAPSTPHRAHSLEFKLNVCSGSNLSEQLLLLQGSGSRNAVNGDWFRPENWHWRRF